MALVTMKRLFDHAMKEKYTVGAYNVFNLDTLVAVLQAAEKEDSPVIVQLSMGSREYQPYFETFVRCVKLYAEAVHVPVGLNHDHCKTVENAKEAIDYGIPSVMFDGSHLSFEENVASTREIVRYAHECGAWVEAELGKMAGFEDEVFAESTQFTDPHQAAEFIRLTGCDSLAVSVGTSHGGVAGDSSLKLSAARFPKAIRWCSTARLPCRRSWCGRLTHRARMCRRCATAQKRIFPRRRLTVWLRPTWMWTIICAIRRRFARSSAKSRKSMTPECI